MLMAYAITPTDILTFWRDAGYDRWFKKDVAFDAEVRARFAGLWWQAANDELSDWEATDDGALALTIALDQFPRNLFRNDPRAFSTDTKARHVAARALDRGADARVDPVLKPFFYLPFMHSERLDDQDRCVTLYESLGEPEQLKFARIHRDIIAKFGRFPHRNPVLGRTMTPEEQAYLDAEGFSG
jgi:uncharacterized protein (DUF924 family)